MSDGEAEKGDEWICVISVHIIIVNMCQRKSI